MRLIAERTAAGAPGTAGLGRSDRATATTGAAAAPAGPLLSLRDNLSPYDGSYVALAESLDCVFLTADTRLSRAPGLRCVVEVVQRLWPVYLDSRVSLHVRHLRRAQAAPLPAQQR